MQQWLSSINFGLIRTLFASTLLVLTCLFGTWFICTLISFWHDPSQTPLAHLLLSALDARGELFPAYMAHTVSIIVSCFIFFLMFCVLKLLINTVLHLFLPSSIVLMKQIRADMQQIKKQLKQ